MSYHVIVKKISTREAPRRTEYKQVSATGGRDGGALYEYVQPPDTEVVSEESVIFEQALEQLDLVAVIKALNGIAS